VFDGGLRFRTVEQTLQAGPMFYAHIVEAIGSNDGREVIQKILLGDDLGTTLRAGDAALEDHVKPQVLSIRHISCTCRMGRNDDPGAVTDNRGRVHGMAGLRVCDASIFPAVPRANTNIPTIMTAEKIADAILSG